MKRKTRMWRRKGVRSALEEEDMKYSHEIWTMGTSMAWMGGLNRRKGEICYYNVYSLCGKWAMRRLWASMASRRLKTGETRRYQRSQRSANEKERGYDEKARRLPHRRLRLRMPSRCLRIKTKRREERWSRPKSQAQAVEVQVQPTEV